MSWLDVLRIFLTIVEILSAVLLIVIILMQRSKSQGLGVAFGGGMGETLFGSQMGNVLTKTTVILAIIFLINTTLLAMIKPGHSVVSDSIADRVSAEVAPLAPPVSQTAYPVDQPVQPLMDMSMPVEPVMNDTAPQVDTAPATAE